MALPVDFAFAATTSSTAKSSSSASTFNGSGTFSRTDGSSARSQAESKYDEDLYPTYKDGDVYDHEYTAKAWDVPKEGMAYKSVATVEYIAWTPNRAKSGRSLQRISGKYVKYDEAGNPVSIDFDYAKGYQGNTAERKYTSTFTFDEFGNQISRVDEYTKGSNPKYDISAVKVEQYDDNGHILKMKSGTRSDYPKNELPESEYNTDVSFNYYDTGVLESKTTEGKSEKHDEYGRVILGTSNSSYMYEDNDKGFVTKCTQTMATGGSSGATKTVVGEFKFNEHGDRTVEKTKADRNSGINSSEYHYDYKYTDDGRLLSVTVTDAKGKRTSELIRTRGEKTNSFMDVRRVYDDTGSAAYVCIDIVEQQPVTSVPFAYRPIDESPEMALAEEKYFVHIGQNNPFQTLRMTDEDVITFVGMSGRAIGSTSTSSSSSPSYSSSRNSNSCGSTFGIFFLVMIGYAFFAVFKYLRKKGLINDVNGPLSGTGGSQPGQSGPAGPMPPPGAGPTGAGGQGPKGAATNIGASLLGKIESVIDGIDDGRAPGAPPTRPNVSTYGPPQGVPNPMQPPMQPQGRAPMQGQVPAQVPMQAPAPAQAPIADPASISIEDLDASSNPIIQAALRATASTESSDSAFKSKAQSDDDWDSDDDFAWDAAEDEDYDDWPEDDESPEKPSSLDSSSGQKQVFVGVDANGNFKPTGNKIIDEILRGYVDGNGDTKNSAG